MAGRSGNEYTSPNLSPHKMVALSGRTWIAHGLLGMHLTESSSSLPLGSAEMTRMHLSSVTVSMYRWLGDTASLTMFLVLDGSVAVFCFLAGGSSPVFARAIDVRLYGETKSKSLLQQAY